MSDYQDFERMLSGPLKVTALFGYEASAGAAVPLADFMLRATSST